MLTSQDYCPGVIQVLATCKISMTTIDHVQIMLVQLQRDCEHPHISPQELQQAKSSYTE